MARKEEVFYALELFHKNRPRQIFEKMNKSDVGVFAVIKYLHESEEEVTSADICKFLQISSARMAVLVKRLEKKGLIVKSNSSVDARSKVLKLSAAGKKFAEDLKSQIYGTMEKIVDEFGLDELEELFVKLEKLKAIMDENVPANLEEYND